MNMEIIYSLASCCSRVTINEGNFKLVNQYRFVKWLRRHFHKMTKTAQKEATAFIDDYFERNKQQSSKATGFLDKA